MFGIYAIPDTCVDEWCCRDNAGAIIKGKKKFLFIESSGQFT